MFILDFVMVMCVRCVFLMISIKLIRIRKVRFNIWIVGLWFIKLFIGLVKSIMMSMERIIVVIMIISVLEILFVIFIVVRIELKLKIILIIVIWMIICVSVELFFLLLFFFLWFFSLWWILFVDLYNRKILFVIRIRFCFVKLVWIRLLFILKSGVFMVIRVEILKSRIICMIIVKIRLILVVLGCFFLGSLLVVMVMKMILLIFSIILRKVRVKKFIHIVVLFRLGIISFIVILGL